MKSKAVAIFAMVFFATVLVGVPLIPSAFAHGGMQPPAADFGGKKASLFLKLDPPVITSTTEPVFITARFFDENSNENFKEVTYRIFFKKDGKEIPIQTEGGDAYGGQGLFYDPGGNLRIKIVPKDMPAAQAKGISEVQYGGIWNNGQPIVVEGPVFTQAGLYNLFVEIHTVGTTRTQVEPILQYDVWVTPGREETVSVPAAGGSTQQVKIRNYYGAIDKSSYDEQTKTIQFSMPYDWKSEIANRTGMLHTEVFIPKALSDFDRESLKGTVNGLDVPVFVDNFGAENTVVHFTISKQHLLSLRDKINAENRSPDQAVFALSPPDPESEVKVMQVQSESSSYAVSLTMPESIFPQQPVPFGVKITGKDGKPASAATYELVIQDADGKEVSRSGGVTTPEGISSQDVAFDKQGSFTVRVEKINATSESVQSSIQVVPEFPVAALVASLGVAGAVVYGRLRGFGLRV
ncbi:hypothetical protein [Nitrososphaera viennensis]|uniref:Uncharacterized protein n=2 Tax=Nitrososphaera viennensis TaxID=1034015 RepID=A0A060HKP0_9ARCH|nr:hypothetical protein [Nitrososphaera viennensis]AIC17084.1 hypothetical protein NVIE_028080 [Nitrososphaera viennensis EN76]UVS68977.1 hypothetical protein NWT39_13855 [Nitrososphaera viennensis]